MFQFFSMTYINNWPKKFFTEKHKNRRQNNVPLKPPACVHVNFWNPLMNLEPPISDFKKFFPAFQFFSMTYINNWPKKFFFTEKHKNRRQNNVPLKPPACEHVNFWNPLMNLEPPISDLIKKSFPRVSVFLYDVHQ